MYFPRGPDDHTRAPAPSGTMNPCPPSPNPPGPPWPSGCAPMPANTGPSWPAWTSSRYAGCVTADPRGPGASPSTWPAVTATKTRSCTPAPSPAHRKKPSTAPPASTSAAPTSDRSSHTRPDHVNPRKTSGLDHYAMALTENATLVPACVQHSVLDPDENAALRTMLPMPAARPAPLGSR